VNGPNLVVHCRRNFSLPAPKVGHHRLRRTAVGKEFNEKVNRVLGPALHLRPKALMILNIAFKQTLKKERKKEKRKKIEFLLTTPKREGSSWKLSKALVLSVV